MDILLAVAVSLIGALSLALVARLAAFAFGRRRGWETWFQVLLVLSIGALLGAVGAAIVQDRGRTSGGTSHHFCVVNLKQIQGAKLAWALDMKKTLVDIPLDADLFGPTQYIREKPRCPEGGTYRLGTVAEKPRCSLGGRHALD